ncbi:MT-A70 family methyltransferase [Sphingosinicella sp. BN140058]|uniref:MT-A70 family methyltransferase n=1 Tax=Sphingosinicella sp. BN140058 TaxID=1892855 RepID=UPI0013EAC37E|nr:MT-A70 family methyltransferase [Sphingosinicella sp. BN140058]
MLTERGLQAPARWSLAHPFANIRSLRGPVPLDLVGGPRERYDLIYADPPWEFENYSEAGEDRNAKSWYDCMSLEELKALPIGDLAADNCMFACWATCPMLPEALELIQHNGFRYVTIGHVWVKLNKRVGLRRIVNLLVDVFMSTGYWTRQNAEFIILASRGSPVRDSRSIRQVVFEPRGKHSEKPLVFRQHLERLVVADRRIELFCRHDATDTWDAWGNQVGAHAAGTIKKRRPAPAVFPLFDLAA